METIQRSQQKKTKKKKKKKSSKKKKTNKSNDYKKRKRRDYHFVVGNGSNGRLLQQFGKEFRELRGAASVPVSLAVSVRVSKVRP